MKYRDVLLALVASTASATPNILTLNPAADSGVRQAPLAVTATVGSSVINNPLFIDQDAVGAPLVADSGNASATTIVSMANPGGGAVNHAPYQVIAWPSTGVTADPSYYSQLYNQIGVISLPHGRGNSVNHQLPVVATTTSSSNSGDGITGWGITFGLSANYLGLNTGSDSNNSGNVAGLIAALLYNHGTWNAFDAQAALRISAANFPTYDHTNYGYGTVSWSAANSASTLYLQPPDMQVTNNGYYLAITLYPYRQTRRSAEVVYSVSASYVWPRKNEYTTTDITASGGTLLYTSNGTDVTPQFSYAPAASGTVTLIAFTTDGSGNYSTEQEFSPVTQSVTVQTSCFQ